MLSLKQITIFALLGTAFAAPAAHWDHHRGNDNTPEGGRMHGSFGNEGGDKYVVVVGTTTSEDTTPTTTVTGTTGSKSSAAATTGAASTGTASTGSSGSQTGYMATVSKWRSAMGLGALTQSSKLEANALKTVQDGKGQMVHELNSGSFGQVLAPGKADEFERVFVGGWLCERPNLTGLNGICSTMSKGWSYNGQTGHADILSSSKYTQIGCALANGIWGCDVA